MSNPNNNTNNKIISDTPAAELNTPATKEAAELNIPSSEVVVEWSTWEELLLASAVKRHGLKDWEAIAMELQTRQDKSVTPQICQNKFHDLQRRFTTTTGGGGRTVLDDVITDGYDVTVPLLEELRKLRVAELKKEVQRYDLSIQSLQSQVKSLEDEREMSSKANEPENNGVNRSDLEKDNNNDINIIDNKNSDNLNSIKEEAERSENGKNDSGKKLEEEICKEPSGDDENRSVNESNSSGNRTGSGLNPNSDRKPVGDDSGHFSSDRKLGDSGELRGGDSGELQGGDTVEDRTTTNTKESSEVQSSASLTTRKRRRRGREGGEIMDGGFSGGDKVEVVNTVEIKRTESLVKSEPLIAFLDVIRSHEHGSVFDHRLDSQKTEEYNNMIRQHVDLQLVHGRLEDGSYSSCPNKFYLDLLLLFNNAIVFFPKSSPEFQAASSLRTLVMEELKKLKNTSERIYESTSMKLQPKFELEASDSLLVKHRSTSAIVVVCRKRSSIAVKPSTSATKTETLADNKPLLHLKLPVKSSSSTPNEDDNSIKFRLKEKPVTGARSVRRGSKSRPNSNPTQSNPSSNQNMSSSSQQSGSAQKGEDMKAVDKKKTELSNAAKKRGAADFLKRIKKTSPAKGSLLEALKGSGDDSKGSKTILPTVQALKVKKKVEEKKVTGPSRRKRNGSGGGRQLKGDDSPSKKNVGRPPKKGKDVPPPKHGRDGESEGSSRRPSKRSRR
ncbi:hypothetical protein LIER_19471 [Lithospermum erythrorhizon]|uniref:DNA-binding bromodomain-containing protein n=1 Tax=Lithospermum erythrorhizon TaxID=34254 RepID=A0AAV3QKI6_LITER